VTPFVAGVVRLFVLFGATALLVEAGLALGDAVTPLDGVPAPGTGELDVPPPHPTSEAEAKTTKSAEIRTMDRCGTDGTPPTLS